MAFNTICIELCAEDRARLDKIAHLLEEIAPVTTGTEKPADGLTGYGYVENGVEYVSEIEAAEVQNIPDPADELPFETSEPVAAIEPAAPKYKLADIQQKVVQLSAGGKKAEVRDIVKAYAEKVSAIPEDKFNEVMEKLTGLEG